MDLLAITLCYVALRYITLRLRTEFTGDRCAQSRAQFSRAVCLRFEWCEGVKQTRQKRRRQPSFDALCRNRPTVRHFVPPINPPPETQRMGTILRRMKNTKGMHENMQPDTRWISQFASNEAEAAAWPASFLPRLSHSLASLKT